MPTYGRVSAYGCLPLAPSMDRPGPLARTAEDCGLLLAALAGHDDRDPASARREVEDPSGRLGRPLAGLRIGAARGGHFGHADDDPAARPAFEAGLEELAALGADVVEVELPHHDATLHAHLVTLLSEAYAVHRDDVIARADGYATGTRGMLELGAAYGPADVANAAAVRDRTQRDLDALMVAIDAIATPTITAGAPTLADLWRDGVGAHAATIHTAYWDAVANPVLSLPCGRTAAGLPLALQLAARPFEEALLVQLGAAYQAATDWHRRLPPRAATGASAAARRDRG